MESFFSRLFSDPAFHVPNGRKAVSLAHVFRAEETIGRKGFGARNISDFTSSQLSNNRSDLEFPLQALLERTPSARESESRPNGP